MGRSGALLGALGALLGRSWGDLGRSWGDLRYSWGALGAVLGHSGRPWALLGRSWDPLEVFWWVWGSIWDRLLVDFWLIWMRFGIGCFTCLFFFFAVVVSRVKARWGISSFFPRKIDALSVSPLGQV